MFPPAEPQRREFLPLPDEAARGHASAEGAATARAVRLARALGLAVGLLGAVGAFLWGLQKLTPPERSVRLIMSAPTAVSLLGLGLAIFLQARGRADGRRWPALLVAAAVLVVRVASLAVHPGFWDAWEPSEWGPGALDVALGAAVIALTVLIGRGSPWRRRVSQVLCVLVLFSGMVAVMGHAFGATPIYALGRLGSVPTSLAGASGMVLLGLAGLAIPPLEGPLAILLSPRVGGIAARRFLLYLLALPLISRLVEVGEDAGLYRAPTALALASLLSGAVCVTLVVRLGQALNRIDGELEAAREAVARKLDWLAAVLEQLPDAVLLVDERGRLTLFNGSARRLLPGVRRGDALLGDGDRGVRLPAVLSAPLEEALGAGFLTVGLESEITLADGAVAPVLMSAAPIRGSHGQRTGAVLLLKDASVFKEIERQREEWTAVVAHDLRQPVAVISLAAQQLLRRGQADPERNAQLAARIHEAAVGLARMVADLLDASRIESSRMDVDPRPVDLGAAVEDVLKQLEDLTPAQGVQLEREQAPLPVRVDVQRLRQVLGNLLSNAAKYGDPGAPIRVTVERRGAEVVVGVHNRGEPLAQEEVDRLFQRFARARNARTQSQTGVGLGLYITRGLIEAHGGRIWAESHGTRMSVCFTLPLASGAHPRPTPVPEPGGTLH